MKILVAGDFCPQYRVANLFEKGEYQSVLGEVKDILSNVDYSIVNFECPVVEGNGEKIKKCGPNLCCSTESFKAIKWVGFNAVTLANNHIRDYGEEGIQKTISKCKQFNIDYVGCGYNLKEASQILYKRINDQTIAIINCCEQEFSIATSKNAGSNPLEPIRQFYAIRKAKEKADYVIVIVHGGHEMYQLPSTRMQETYRFFVDSGADAVINHHQHCFSGYEMYNNKPILYGLGNFCFDKKIKKDSIWYEGYMVILDFSQEINITIIPYVQCKENPSISLLDNSDKMQVLERITILNKIISDKDLLIEKENNYYTNCKSWSASCFLSNNKIINTLIRRGVLPLRLSENRKLKLYNAILCESHLEKIKFYLSN